MRATIIGFGAAALVAAFVAGASAAEQGVNTKLLLVKDPPSEPTARKINWKVKQLDTDDELSVVGDPTTGGATLRIRLQVSNHCSNPPCDSGGGDQCFTLPASGWSSIGSLGFKYKDPTLANGAVKVAQIKETAAGVFQIKAALRGAGIALFLDDEIGFYGVNLALGGGDQYYTGSGGAEPKPNDGETFKVVNETGGASMAACSPSGAFVD
jgi:hypothetical protein